MENKIKVLEVNNIDLPGRRFNGYDTQLLLNQKPNFSCKQIVVYKHSNDEMVEKFFDNFVTYDYFHKLMEFEDKMSIHSNLSLTTPALLDKSSYKEADIVHFHMYHNTRISLYSLIEMCQKKRVVLSFHDPWPITGRCVHYGECEKWKTGCHECEKLNTLFPFKVDNCNKMWKLKQLVYKNINPDIVVHSKYMLDIVKQSPLTKKFNKVHFIPFGIDLKTFSKSISNEEAKAKLNINSDDIVLFFRNQKEFKGVEYIIEALKTIKTDKKITVLTCDGETGLEELKNQYNVVELGLITNKELIYAYNACDIFLMPSIGESFGMMAIEAMACEKPVIVFNNTALPSVTYAPECGVLVDNKDSHKLMEAIKYLIDNPQERERRGKLGRKICEENYDINTYNEAIVNLYEEIYKSKLKKTIIPTNTKEINLNSIEVQKIMNKLNEFTRQEFDKSSKEYNTLIYDCKKIESDDIDYSKLDVQNLINDYNEKLYSVLNNKEFKPRKNGKIKQIKNAIKLLIKDKNRFKNSIQYKFNQIFKKKD